MLTDTSRVSTRVGEFVRRGTAGSLGFLGLLRLPWTEVHLVLPLIRAQGAAAVRIAGAPVLPVEVTLACSGADALALCLGAILAYPVAWRSRLTGAALGIGLILGLNILRIGTLGRAAASPAWFNLLHLYLWPAALTLAIAGFVFAWMRATDNREASVAAETAPPSRRFVVPPSFSCWCSSPSRRCISRAGVLALAWLDRRAAAAILGVIGLDASATANTL